MPNVLNTPPAPGGPTVAAPAPTVAPLTDTPPVPPGRRFGDHAAVREHTFNNALNAVSMLPPVENSRYRLSITQPKYEGKSDYTPEEVKHATLSRRTLARRLTGTVTLTDKATDKVVDSRRMTVAHIPFLTDRGTYVLDGSPSVLSHQLRLDPGVYVRRKSNNQIEAHINTLGGEGVQHRLRLEPETGVIKLDVGQAELPALPLLRSLGASEEELKHTLGDKLYAVNNRAAKPHHLRGIYDRLGPPGAVPEEGALSQALATHLGKVKFDPWVMQRTLGMPETKYTKQVALAAVKKVLDVSHGKAEPDDRDSLVYQTLHGPEHLIPERLSRSGPAMASALWPVTNKGNLSPLNPGFLSKAVRSVFTLSGLGQNPEGVSALEFVDHGSRVTKVGQGGIGRSADAVPAESRDVSPSHFLYLDPIRTSESESVGLDLRTAFGTRLGADKRLYAPVRDTKTNRIVYRSPRDMADSTLAFPGPYQRGAQVVPAIANGRMTYVPRKQVDYAAPSMEQAFSPLTNLVQLKSASKPHRASMGARMTSQALVLSHREAPLVMNGVPGQRGKSFEELYGRHAGAVFADDQPGKVTALDKHSMSVQYADGSTKSYPLHNNDPIGRSSMLHSTPMAQIGDTFKPGQILARSNQTDDQGRSVYGVNARVGFVPLVRGPQTTYEDSIITSRSFANKLTSEHLYPHRFEVDEHTIPGKAAYAATFPGTHPVKMFDSYTPDGVVKPGTKVDPGQPLVLAVRRRQGEYGVLKSKRAGTTDASLTWDHETPGEVADVVPMTGGGWAVTVKTHKPLNDGDKLCYDGATEVMTTRGWVKISAVTVADEVLTLSPNTATSRYLQPIAVQSFRHTGDMYQIMAGGVDLLITPNHKLYVAPVEDGAKYGLIEARNLEAKKYRMLRDIGVSTVFDAVTDVNEVEYDASVYCVTMPKWHVIYVRRNGKPVWCGNSGLHGNKGVAMIVADHEMPHTQDGRPLDVLYSSLGVTSRVNPSQMIIGALAKAAEARGRPYVVHDFDNIPHLAKFAKGELDKYGLKDKEPVTDPMTGHTTPPVNVGSLYMMKLSHMSEKKVKGHGVGAYDESGVPVRGESGASRMSMGDTMALLSHGATDVLRDLKLYRGQENNDLWASYMAGYPLQRPTVSRQYTRFLDMLRGAGVDPVRNGSKTRLTALTQRKVDELTSGRVVKNADTMDAKSGRPVKGGLMDPEIWGAVDSANHWAKIPLHEPLINPVFEDPARHMLGLTENQYREVIGGTRKLPGGGSGPGAIASALRNIDVPADLKQARSDLQSNRKGTRDSAARRLGYLKGLVRNNQTPGDWVLDGMPVLPPAHRPVRNLAGGRGGTVTHDSNLLYKEVFAADQAVRALHGRVGDLSNERLGVYDAAKAAFGLGEPTDPRNQARQVKGVLREIFPGSAKTSYVQQRLLGTPADLSGRGQIVPNADLDMDQVGLPEHLAWEVFQPSVVRRLVRQGVPRVEALRLANDKHPKAKAALLSEMEERPVTMTRYPVLHRYNTIAQWPKLVAGDAIHVNPVITKSMSADYDGDTVTIHAPLEQRAIEDAKHRMLPSRNLLSQATFKATNYGPNMEFIQGLDSATRGGKDIPPKLFRKLKDAEAAYHRAEIGLDTPVEVMEK